MSEAHSNTPSRILLPPLHHHTQILVVTPYHEQKCPLLHLPHLATMISPVIPHSLKAAPTNGMPLSPEMSGHHVQRSTPSQITASCEIFAVIVETMATFAHQSSYALIDHVTESSSTPRSYLPASNEATVSPAHSPMSWYTGASRCSDRSGHSNSTTSRVTTTSSTTHPWCTTIRQAETSTRH